LKNSARRSAACAATGPSDVERAAPFADLFDTAIHAAMRAGALFDEGDMEGARTFRMIVKKINELQRGAATLQ